MTASPPALIFVYGTLKRGGVNHRQLAGQTFRGPAQTAPGFRLCDLGDYPGLVADPADRAGVTGELWAVDATCLARLDRFEGVPEQLYRRARVPLLGSFAGECAEAYFYARDCRGARAVPGGVWPVL